MSFTANNMPEYTNYPLLQSMLKVFSLVKFQFKFYKDEVTEVFIQCNSCNKTTTCQFFETVLIEFYPGFIKSIVFYHAGLSWMIEIKDQYKIAVEYHFIEWCTV